MHMQIHELLSGGEPSSRFTAVDGDTAATLICFWVVAVVPAMAVAMEIKVIRDSNALLKYLPP